MESFNDVFKLFLTETVFTETLDLFKRSCLHADVMHDDANGQVFEKFMNAAGALNATGMASHLFECLEKVRTEEVYGGGKIGQSKKVIFTSYVHLLVNHLLRLHRFPLGVL